MIEKLNAAAGDYLTERHRQKEPGKWRHNPLVTEQMWVLHLRQRGEDGQPKDGPLTSKERAHMEKDIRMSDLKNRLRTWVESGVLNYVLCPLVFLFGLLLVFVQRGFLWKVVAVVATVLAAVTGSFALFRDYVGLLGW
ncbi:MAG: hypothetical protein HY300_13370 [Verrucomicrobia bacterium]|nr:hypothetical protein [Verrucomicrobiota bacterium]